MSNKQLEMAEQLIALITKRNGRADMDAVQVNLLVGTNTAQEENDLWLLIKNTISTLVSKNVITHNGNLLELKNGGSLAFKYLKLNSKLQQLLEEDGNRITLPHSDESTKRFIDDKFISLFSGYTADKSTYNIDKLKVEQFLADGGYPIKTKPHQVIDKSQHINVGRDLSGNVVQSSDLRESPVFFEDKKSIKTKIVATATDPTKAPFMYAMKWVAGIISGIIVAYIVYRMGWI